jgi:hypothetical protein
MANIKAVNDNINDIINNVSKLFILFVFNKIRIINLIKKINLINSDKINN